MGQYYKGSKIGTCESMYYMRLKTAQELAEQGDRDDDGIKFSDYLADNQTKWRFPFPDEDNGIPSNCKYNRAFTIPIGEVEVSHDTICIHNEFEHGGHGVNVFIPCIYSQEFKNSGLKLSMGGAGEQHLDIVMEGIRDCTIDGKIVRKVKTIFKCSRCGEMQRFDDADVEKIKARAREHFEPYNMEGKNAGYNGNQEKYDEAMKIIERIH